jgi:hypothetical protein
LILLYLLQMNTNQLAEIRVGRLLPIISFRVVPVVRERAIQNRALLEYFSWSF